MQGAVKEATSSYCGSARGGLTQKVNVLDFFIVINGRRLPISQKYNDLGQLAESTDNTWWAQRLLDSTGGRTYRKTLRNSPLFYILNTKVYIRLINPLNPELNPICYLLALLAHRFLHVSRIRVKSLTIRLLMSYIWSTYS